MLTDEAGVQLHHRASLGEKLTPEERAALEAWYAKHDAEEAAMFAQAERRQSGTYRMPNGREVFLTHLSIRPTYQGLRIGSAEFHSRVILESLPEIIQRIMPPGKPLVVVPPAAMPLPSFFWVARLESKAGVKNKDSDYHSFLFVCWFANGFRDSIDSRLENVLCELDWDASAEDYDFMDF